MRLYYSVKGRFGHQLSNKDQFVQSISKKLMKELPSNINHIIIPESSNSFIEDVVSLTGIKYTVIKKNNIDYIISKIDSLNLQKKEKIAHLERINKMDGSFKINELKSNQRRKYLPFLFSKSEEIFDENSIIIDDSSFSGTTYEALKLTTNIEKCFFIFSK